MRKKKRRLNKSTVAAATDRTSPFQPSDEQRKHDAEVAARHAADVQCANERLRLASIVSAFAKNQLQVDDALLERIQQMRPESIDHNMQGKLEAERNIAMRMVNGVTVSFAGEVTGWLAGIQSLRAIEERTPGAVQPPSRLLCPDPPDELLAYAAANRIPLI